MSTAVWQSRTSGSLACLAGESASGSIADALACEESSMYIEAGVGTQRLLTMTFLCGSIAARLCEDERQSIGFIERLYSFITSSIVGSLFPTGRGSKKALNLVSLDSTFGHGVYDGRPQTSGSRLGESVP